MALSEELKTSIREAMQSVTVNMPGFRSRAGQRRMIAEISKTLAGEYGGRQVICAEGPTGTGKSLGYMLGAIPLAQKRGQKVILSTATVALQEQIAERDLPAFKKASGLNFSFVLAKGRGRYVCPRNLHVLVGPEQPSAQAEMDLDIEAGWTTRPTREMTKTVENMLASFDDGRWSGDLDEWSEQLSEELVKQVTTTSSGCSRAVCPHRAGCPFFAAREDLDAHDVIVANHDLVLSDLSLGGGVVLTKPEESVYVFDEGHHLYGKALNHFAASAALLAGKKWLRGVSKTVRKACELFAEDDLEKQRVTAMGAAEHLITVIDEVHGWLNQVFPEPKKTRWRQGDPVWRFEMGRADEHLVELAKRAKSDGLRLAGAIETIKDAIEGAVKERRIPIRDAERVLTGLGIMAHRAEAMNDMWQMFSIVDNAGSPPCARWITRQDRGGAFEYTLTASPVSAATYLNEALWNKAAGVVVTSATLTALGSFDMLREQLGLLADDGTQYLKLDSPFNYDNAELVVPAMKANPKDPEAHTAEVIAHINKIINPEEGTLVLFSSAKQMREVADRMDPFLAQQVLMQRDIPKAEILRRHVEAIDAGKGSIIFGLASFAEGVDLPGKYCSHVIIAKLPFTVPDDPITATLSEWMKANGRDPFMEISVPEASLRLIQACGRLIRSEEDTGRITLLDTRVSTHQYGRRMLDTLPRFKRRIEARQGHRRAVA